MREFFALPDADKRGIERTATNSWGFYDRELTKNRRDWKQVFDVGPDEVDGPLAGMTAQWPRALPALRPMMKPSRAACDSPQLPIALAISRALETPPADLHAPSYRVTAASCG